jgi:hypothetical protein
MATQHLKTVPKISVQIWRPALEQFTKRMEAACLRRDLYLNRVLENELDQLDSEVPIPNTPLARDFIAKRLDTLDRKLVSLALDPKLVARLNDICARKRIVRDSFFNRLLLLLAASPKMIDRLYFMYDEDDGAWRRRVIEAYRHDGAFYRELLNPLEPNTDPLWPLRAAHELENEKVTTEDWTVPETGQVARITRSLAGEPHPLTTIYTQVFHATTFKDADMTGLNVYLPDSYVPGSEAAAVATKTLDDLMLVG